VLKYALHPPKAAACENRDFTRCSRGSSTEGVGSVRAVSAEDGEAQ
jgi:hypothetical protein